jgi:hypothetical protein
MPECFEEVQRPIYGWPPAGGAYYAPPQPYCTSPPQQQAAPQARPAVTVAQMPPEYASARLADEPPPSATKG